MLTSTDIIKRDGWTRTAIAKFLPHPDATETWRYAGHGSGLRYFYDDDRVLKVESSAKFETWKEQRAARIANATIRAGDAQVAVQARKVALAYAKARRLARLADLYPDWHNALPVACNYLVDLNRYAKHRECGLLTRDTILRVPSSGPSVSLRFRDVDGPVIALPCAQGVAQQFLNFLPLQIGRAHV